VSARVGVRESTVSQRTVPAIMALGTQRAGVYRR